MSVDSLTSQQQPGHLEGLADQIAKKAVAPYLGGLNRLHEILRHNLAADDPKTFIIPESGWGFDKEYETVVGLIGGAAIERSQIIQAKNRHLKPDDTALLIGDRLLRAIGQQRLPFLDAGVGTAAINLAQSSSWLERRRIFQATKLVTPPSVRLDSANHQPYVSLPFIIGFSRTYQEQIQSGNEQPDIKQLFETALKQSVTPVIDMESLAFYEAKDELVARIEDLS